MTSINKINQHAVYNLRYILYHSEQSLVSAVNTQIMTKFQLLKVKMVFIFTLFFFQTRGTRGKVSKNIDYYVDYCLNSNTPSEKSTRKFDPYHAS